LDSATDCDNIENEPYLKLEPDYIKKTLLDNNIPDLIKHYNFSAIYLLLFFIFIRLDQCMTRKL